MLKTGAPAQYPLQSSTRFRTQTVEFLDGSRQTYPLQGRALRSWALQLNLLDEQELRAVADFVTQAGSRTFLFSDPVTGEGSIKCILGGDSFDLVQQDELRGQATLLIKEVL
jgi:phage-related protein